MLAAVLSVFQSETNGGWHPSCAIQHRQCTNHSTRICYFWMQFDFVKLVFGLTREFIILANHRIEHNIVVQLSLIHIQMCIRDRFLVVSTWLQCVLVLRKFYCLIEPNSSDHVKQFTCLFQRIMQENQSEERHDVLAKHLTRLLQPHTGLINAYVQDSIFFFIYVIVKLSIENG